MNRRPQNRYERRLSKSYSNLRKPRISPAAGVDTVRPHGGYKGVPEHFPLSINTFDKPDNYVEDVRNTVQTHYAEEENKRCGSPQWVSRYNEESNHTGEQPLIVQQFLSGNKQEQRNGVLPSRADTPPRLKSAPHRYRGEEIPEYFHGNSTHQYLTATEMPGQSEQLFNIKHGRPTRTSLLRTRYRAQSAPGVRALLEIDHLHKQQHMAAKTEDRFKSVDVPQDLQPLTDPGETIHQFIIGARYNRNIYKDPTWLAATGGAVPSRHSQTRDARQDEVPNTSNSYDSFSSSELLVSPRNEQPIHPAKQAWGSNTSLNKSRPVSGRTTAPTPTPLNSSRETFTSSHNSFSPPVTSSFKHELNSKSHQVNARQSTAPSRAQTIIDGRALHDTHAPSGGVGGGCEDCIMCRKGVPLKGMPGTFSKKTEAVRRSSLGGGGGKDGGDKVGGKDTKIKIKETVDHQLVQQYHLRILGVKMEVDQVRPQSPRAKLNYTTTSRPHSARKQSNNNHNANANNINTHRRQKKDEMKEDADDADRMDENSMRSSMISVRISTPCFDDHYDEQDVEPTPRDEDEGDVTPRLEDEDGVQEQSPIKEGGDTPAGEQSPREGDGKQETSEPTSSPQEGDGKQETSEPISSLQEEGINHQKTLPTSGDDDAPSIIKQGQADEDVANNNAADAPRDVVDEASCVDTTGNHGNGEGDDDGLKKDRDEELLDGVQDASQGQHIDDNGNVELGGDDEEIQESCTDNPVFFVTESDVKIRDDVGNLEIS